MDSVPSSLVDFLTSHASFLVAGHHDPDADCIGSQLALASVLRRRGATVTLVNEGPFERQEIREYQHHFRTPQDDQPPPEAAAVIVVDCPGGTRLGEVVQRWTAQRPTAVVDHHPGDEARGDVLYIDSRCPAAAILVHRIAGVLGASLTEEEARWLYLGLAADTGFFRFLAAHQDEAFTVAADLVRCGASPRETDRMVSSGRSLESRRLIARMLDRVEALRDGAFLVTWQSLADEREFGTRRDSDALHRLLLAVENVRAIAVIRERADGCSVSFRAVDETDVSALASLLGGGGHHKAAGAKVPGELAHVLQAVRHVFLTT